MAYRIAIIALGALCSIFSGCGCSKEKPKGAGEVATSRLQDAAYTNRLVQLRAEQAAAAAKAAEVRARIAKLGTEAEKSAAYIDLTNQLARCEAETQRIRKETLTTIRARVLKEAESAKKGNLKK